jgi:hypothetical protein
MSERPQITQSIDEHAVGTALPRSSATSRGRFARPAPSPHTHKFRTATAVLVGFAIGAILIAAAIAVSGRGGHASVAWSAWSPPDSGNQGAQDIADHLAPNYRISSVDQLAVVTVVNLESAAAANAAAQASANGTTASPSSGLQVAVRPSATSSAISLLTGNTIAYNVCGIGGKHCAIGAGTPSTNRMLLLRREALELALYTFKYLGGVQNVVAILPPSRTETTSTLTKTLPTTVSSGSKTTNMAVLFVRQELQPLLNEPLSDTLPEEFPPAVAQMSSAPEAGLVEQVTARGLFSEQVQQAQDGSNLIVLDPLPPS